MDDAFPSTEHFPEGVVPPCPICRRTDDTVFYGRQNYLVSDGRIPSLIFRCTCCDFNYRRFDRPLSDVVSHFKVAPYSADEIEQEWRRRREGFYHYLLGLLKGSGEGKSLLDIGCAFGHFLDCAVAHGYRPFGTEVSEEMVSVLRRRRDYPVSVRSLDDLQLPEERFDVITFVDSFYYFADPLSTLQRCRPLLKPGGELLMRVTNRNPLARLHRLARMMTFRGATMPEMPLWTTDDAISCHSRRSLTKLINMAGFRMTKLTGRERGKKTDSPGLRTFYALTGTLALLTVERVCYNPGIVCLATVDSPVLG